MIRILLSALIILCTATLCADNQTSTTTTVLPPDSLPFTVSIDLMNISLPNGWHSGISASSGSKWLFMAGRTNGLHGFLEPPVNDFPPQKQNSVVYVVDFKNQQIYQRDLTDPETDLTLAQIDSLSVTSPQFFQSGNTLYVAGGYGIDTASGLMTTKSTFSAIDIPGLIKWVINPCGNESVAKCVRQTSHPLVQVTGGYMDRASPHDPVLLIFGQKFTGLYNDNFSGMYTQQVRSFYILDNGKDLFVQPTKNQGGIRPEYRRRDLNVVPVMKPGKAHPNPAFVALSGVFTESSGIWNIPVTISPDGRSITKNEIDPLSFKQGMNNYASANFELYSNSGQNMYIILFGGLTYGYFSGGNFVTDPEIPYTNQVTTIKIDNKDIYSQYLMENQYPTVLSNFTTPPKPLYFGTGAAFVPKQGLPLYSNGVLALDGFLTKPQVIGYIVGGIQSTVLNTVDQAAETAASPYIFQVTITPR